MALRIRFQCQTGLSLGYSIERLADGLFFDFNNSTFVVNPTRLIAVLPEDTGSFIGRYKTTLTPTPLAQFMDGDYDDNFYFNNPVDYVASLSDPWYLHHLSQNDIRLATGHGPYEDSGPTYRFAEVLSQKGIPHTVDNWGPDGGHDWPFWKNMMNNYLSRLPF